MAETSQFVRDDDYEEMGASYQCLQVSLLDTALREHGIADAAIRQKVCESFLFAMGNIHDQCWLKPTADAEPVYPLLCFSKRFLNSDTPVEELGPIYAPSPMFAFHEYAHASASLLYENDPNSEIETGHCSSGPDA